MKAKEFKMVDFTEVTWYGYMGAERFANGDEPMIGTYGDLQVIVDKNGMLIELGIEQENAWTMSSVNGDKDYLLEVVDNLIVDVKGKSFKQICKYMDENYERAY